MPISVHGIVNSMMNGSRSDLNCDAMIMNTTITARPIARPRPENVVRISSTWPTKSNVEPRGARIACELSARARRPRVPMSRPSVCISTCAARGSWLRSIAIGPVERAILPYAPSVTAAPRSSTRTGTRRQRARDRRAASASYDVTT